MEDNYDFVYSYQSETGGIVVRIEPIYLDEDSQEEGQHLWTYYVQIENNSSHVVQLKSRYWRIIDAKGGLEELHGAGVDGEQPVLNPGDTFEYNSFTALETPSGFMEGFYDMQLENGNKLQVSIPSFNLDKPGEVYSLN